MIGIYLKAHHGPKNQPTCVEDQNKGSLILKEPMNFRSVLLRKLLR